MTTRSSEVRKANALLRDAAREAVGRYYKLMKKRGKRNWVGVIWCELLYRMRDALEVLEPGITPENQPNGGKKVKTNG